MKQKNKCMRISIARGFAEYMVRLGYEAYVYPTGTITIDRYSYIPYIFSESIHPHMLRHTKAFHLLEAGVNLIYIRDFLGHVNVTTTKVYLRADIETKQKALESMYIDVVSQDISIWDEDTNLLSWLQDLCR